ncbi:MAG: 5'-3' exonuclease H3TH domain-containing protein, partial [candidate division Zixibacteria bacterium]|nr:5'-3' exonuclease H3TH domain-containing protein [candidate division Zixibacteria bacterium]
MMKNKTLYLVDGSSVFYRAYFAFIRNPLINSKGENISATYGYINSILKIIKDEKPDYLAIVFDTKEPTFRHKKYSEYKSTRAKMPEDLVEQLPRIRQTTEVLNIPYYEMAGFEADDIIGTMAVAGAEKGMDVYCVTGDKDYFQLVNDKISIYYPKSGGAIPIKMGREEVKEKFGVYPEMVIDKLALMGDSSDNVPGVPGVGPKTADTLLTQFGTLEKILDGSEEIKAKGVRKKISENKDKALLSKELVTIETKVPIEYDLKDLKRKQINYDATKALFMELELTRLLKMIITDTDISKESVPEKKETKAFYHQVNTLDDLKKLVKEFSKVKQIAVDTETTSLNTFEAELVGVSLAERDNTAYYIPLNHEETEKNLPFDKALTELRKILENKKIEKIGQNIKYDLKVLKKYDLNIEPISFDTMVAAYVINPSSRRYSLDFLALKYFDYQMQPITDLIGTGKKQKSFATVSVDKAVYYAAEDADLTFRLRKVFDKQLK